MTPPPQPKYLFITEEELENINTREKPNPDCVDGLDHGSKRIGLANWERKQIMDRVRSHPAPTPAAPHECFCITEESQRCNWLKAHDATIRNQTLDEIQAWSDKIKSYHNGHSVNISTKDIEALIKSLRTQAQQHERGDPR